VIFQHKNHYIGINPALNDIALLKDLLQNFMSVVCQGLKLILLRGCFFSFHLTASFHYADNAFYMPTSARLSCSFQHVEEAMCLRISLPPNKKNSQSRTFLLRWIGFGLSGVSGLQEYSWTDGTDGPAFMTVWMCS
jgi:hypothetical protein